MKDYRAQKASFNKVLGSIYRSEIDHSMIRALLIQKSGYIGRRAFAK